MHRLFALGFPNRQSNFRQRRTEIRAIVVRRTMPQHFAAAWTATKAYRRDHQNR